MESDPMLGATDAEYETEELSENERRWARAVSELQIVIPSLQNDGTATGVYEVLTESQSAYIVDPVEWACSCPDFVYNDPEGGCKHLRRVRLLDEVDEEFPRRHDDATAYVDRLRDVLDALEARRDILAGRVFDDGEIAVEPDAPTEEYRQTTYLVEKLSDHDTLE